MQDSVDQFLQIGVAVRCLAHGHFVQHTAQTVQVTLVGLDPVLREQFGCHLVGSAFFVLHQVDHVIPVGQVGYLD